MEENILQFKYAPVRYHLTFGCCSWTVVVDDDDNYDDDDNDNDNDDNDI